MLKWDVIVLAMLRWNKIFWQSTLLFRATIANELMQVNRARSTQTVCNITQRIADFSFSLILTDGSFLPFHADETDLLLPLDNDDWLVRFLRPCKFYATSARDLVSISFTVDSMNEWLDLSDMECLLLHNILHVPLNFPWLSGESIMNPCKLHLIINWHTISKGWWMNCCRWSFLPIWYVQTC